MINLYEYSLGPSHYESTISSSVVKSILTLWKHNQSRGAIVGLSNDFYCLSIDILNFKMVSQFQTISI